MLEFGAKFNTIGEGEEHSAEREGLGGQSDDNGDFGDGGGYDDDNDDGDGDGGGDDGDGSDGLGGDDDDDDDDDDGDGDGGGYDGDDDDDDKNTFKTNNANEEAKEHSKQPAAAAACQWLRAQLHRRPS